MFHLSDPDLCMCEEFWRIDYSVSALLPPTLPLSPMSGWLSVDNCITAYYLPNPRAWVSQLTVGPCWESWNCLPTSYLMSFVCFISLSSCYHPTILCLPNVHCPSFSTSFCFPLSFSFLISFYFFLVPLSIPDPFSSFSYSSISNPTHTT